MERERMEREMSGAERRKKLVALMREASGPIPGERLGRETGVSRQIVVQDIALLRTGGHPIISTPRGYYLDGPRQAVRLFKTRHTNEQVEDELTTIVDLGGSILDVIVNHRVYGKLSAPLNIKSRRDIQRFMKDIRSGKSSLLSNVTSGYHFHTVSAEQEAFLDEIGEALCEKHYLAELLPYEKEN